MADLHNRKTERLARTGDVDAQARWLLTRKRTMSARSMMLCQERIKDHDYCPVCQGQGTAPLDAGIALASYLGHPAARRLSGGCGWCEGLGMESADGRPGAPLLGKGYIIACRECQPGKGENSLFRWLEGLKRWPTTQERASLAVAWVVYASNPESLAWPPRAAGGPGETRGEQVFRLLSVVDHLILSPRDPDCRQMVLTVIGTLPWADGAAVASLGYYYYYYNGGVTAREGMESSVAELGETSVREAVQADLIPWALGFSDSVPDRVVARLVAESPAD